MRPIKRRSSRLRTHTVRRLSQMRRHWCLQRMMVMQCRRLRTGGSRDLWTFQAPLLRLLDDHVGAGLVGGMVQKTTDIVYKQGVQQVSDLLFVGEFQCPFKRNPETYY